MVLIKRREYRAMFESFLEFRRQSAIRTDNPLVFEPLENLPYLYQSWGTLIVIQAVVQAASAAGFAITRQRMVWPTAGGAYVSVLRDNRIVVELENASGDVLRVYPERTYSRTGRQLRSISFDQRPDVAVELVRADGTTEVVLFDPKYKLDSEDETGSDGTPKKVDIDKMHAYRDAIRDADNQHVVQYAAILYPGATRTYGDDVAAIRAYPGEAEGLGSDVMTVVTRLLSGNGA